MSYTSENWRVAVSNLIKKTSKREVEWDYSVLYKGDAWQNVERSFECQIGDKYYVVSQTTRKNYIDEDDFYWVSGYDLSIFIYENAEYIKIASAPRDLNIVETLFSAAEENFAFSRDALGDLLE